MNQLAFNLHQKHFLNDKRKNQQVNSINLIGPLIKRIRIKKLLVSAIAVLVQQIQAAYLPPIFLYQAGQSDPGNSTDLDESSNENYFENSNTKLRYEHPTDLWTVHIHPFFN
ncbi:hypothetical protein [Mucilaginibacter aquatilis]|uniref:hypothetical protein n=1 Tax=Mucilaginibacter aquatilis TaxID=1517760 RepID=UPI0018DDF4D6|nr:hypothetical protein [Mucilaginibacter aquatilis]